MDVAHWEHFDHGADIGVRGVGATKTEAFIQAALALTAVITPPESVAQKARLEFDCEAPDDELLFVDWLNRLIFEMASRNMLFSRFELQLMPSHLHASVWGEEIDQTKHQPVVEVKGATYTALKVFQDSQGAWCAQTVVDV